MIFDTKFNNPSNTLVFITIYTPIPMQLIFSVTLVTFRHKNLFKYYSYKSKFNNNTTHATVCLLFPFSSLYYQAIWKKNLLFFTTQSSLNLLQSSSCHHSPEVALNDVTNDFLIIKFCRFHTGLLRFSLSEVADSVNSHSFSYWKVLLPWLPRNDIFLVFLI